MDFRWLNGHLFGRGLFVRFTASAFCKLPSICVFGCFPFGFEGSVWDLVVSLLIFLLSALQDDIVINAEEEEPDSSLASRYKHHKVQTGDWSRHDGTDDKKKNQMAFKERSR